MTEKKTYSGQTDTLRKRAEDVFREKAAGMEGNLEANRAAPPLLRVARSTLVRQPLTRFILPEDQDIFYRHRKQLFETGTPQSCELRMVKKDETALWAHLERKSAQKADSAPVCRAIMSDITERKRAD